MENTYRKASEAAAYIRSRIGDVPKIAVILGSGLGTLADVVKDKTEICYQDIPGFPQTTVEGHEGKLVCGFLGDKRVLVMKGRFHYYEGYEIPQVVFHIRVFKHLGIECLLVTNAAGGINRAFKLGDLMLISDHISFFAPSPLRGANQEEFGARFPDMSAAYDRDLIQKAEKAALEEGMEIKKGVYAFTQGPMYETPAEIRALAILGADAVGMSTVPEVIAARHAGIKVLGISCITNMASGILDRPLRHGEVTETAQSVEKIFKKLIMRIVGEV